MAKRGKLGSGRPQQTREVVINAILVAAIILVLLFLLETLRQNSHESPLPPSVSQPQQPAPPGEALPQQSYSSPAVTIALPPPSDHPGTARIAIIIDDMGRQRQEAESLISIGVPLTFSVIPGMPHGADVAQLAYGKGYGVMIHIPMEPREYPLRRIEENGLLVAMADAEIQRRLTGYLRLVPHATGANNHMGSRFTEDEAKMGVVLRQLKAQQLFFIDSVTSPHTVALGLARRYGLRTAARDVFLDNVQEVSAIRKQLMQLERRARRKGSAIGICHPHPATIFALQQELPLMQKRGVTFVLVSELVR
ncbi:MAG TPA: divergent polysaccharide deacetylase family protein [Geobacterales bacterium]|nr:divergent polysaccharide deacetylase family protein [Geobacterales bacterium]